MRVDLRVKHDIEARKAAIGLFERGHGFKSAAKAAFSSGKTFATTGVMCSAMALPF